MDYENECNGGIVKAVTLAECSNMPLNPSGINGPIVGKIPVVIAEPIVQVVVEAQIELEEPAIEIKRIKKNLFINQCKLIDLGGNTGKLFLGGFVRKNIEFATVKCVSEENKSISGDIRHTTVNVPFNCVTQIHFVSSPNTRFCEGPKEASLFFDTMKDDTCGESIMGSSPCEQNFQHTECFNERVFCELEDVKFFEDDIHVDVMDGNFVENIAIGLCVAKWLSKGTRLRLDAHLAISRPQDYIDAFADAGMPW